MVLYTHDMQWRSRVPGAGRRCARRGEAGGMSSRRWIAALAVAGALLPVAAAADDPAPGTPQWHAAEVQNWAATTGRTADQLGNPEYWLLRQQQADTANADPYRAPERWAPRRGQVWPVGYENRYGARISGHVWAPRAGTPGAPYPAVVMVNGGGDREQEYWPFAQDLAEHGYVVLTFDPQGAGASEADPDPEHCEPGGAWTRPQELGVRESGPCAGQNGDEVSMTTGQVPGVVDLVVGGHTGQQGTLDVQELYETLEPNYVLGAIDAHGFLLSGAHPARRLVDPRRVGLMGHSLGAHAAALTANGDPRRRFRAAVAMDSFARLGHGVQPRVPTMYLQSEQELFSGPRLAPPPPEALHATRLDYPAYVRRDVPVLFGVLAGSTHQEFAYVGPESRLPASATGQRVASYYALAWLDRWLGGRTRAETRLLAKTFDDSVDVSNIGLGRWNAATQQNEPHLLAGRPVRDALSRYYASRADLGRVTCDDLRDLRTCMRAAAKP